MLENTYFLIIFTLTIVIFSFTYFYKLSKKIKAFICLITLLEGFSLFLFYPWFPAIYSVLFIIMSSAYLLYLNKEKWINFTGGSVKLVNSSFILNFLLPYKYQLGLSLILSIIALETQFGDGQLSLPTYSLFFVGLSLVTYDYVPNRLFFEKNFI